MGVISGVWVAGLIINPTGKGEGDIVRSGRQACNIRLAMIINEIASERGGNHMDAILLQ